MTNNTDTQIPDETELARIISAISHGAPFTEGENGSVIAGITLAHAINEMDVGGWVKKTFNTSKEESGVRIYIRDNQKNILKFEHEYDALNELSRLTPKSMTKKLLYRIYKDTGVSISEPNFDMIRIIL
jgi:hypothetical protein